MKFVLPSGETHTLSIAFIASSFDIETGDAIKKEREMAEMLKEESYIPTRGCLYSEEPGEINFACLVAVIINHYAPSGTVPSSSYDYKNMERNHERYHRHSNLINDLLFLLYKSF